MKERIVCIEWDDASCNAGYYDEKYPEKFEPVFSKTVGHLVKKDKKCVIVSQERFYENGKPDGDRHIVTIPKKMIRKIVELKGGIDVKSQQAGYSAWESLIKEG